MPFVIRSPLFPPEKSVEVPLDADPIAQTSSVELYIQLAEPTVFLQGFESRHIAEKCPGILRGSLIVRVLKPSKIKNISLSFKGYSRTEWPEGIPPKRQDFVEINDIINHTWPFYQAENSISTETNPEKTSVDDAILQTTGASLFKPDVYKRQPWC